MKILVINTGSSSIKYQLFDLGSQDTVMASGIVERIGEDTSFLNYKRVLPGDDGFEEKTEECSVADHHEGMSCIVDLLVDPNHGSIKDKKEISAVGHRVVHGGETFHVPTIIDEKVIEAIEDNIPLAPLHNPSNLVGIKVAELTFPDIPQVAVFDTAFHQTMPMKAFLYAVPLEMYKKNGIRRYGFHGTSHAYVAEKAAEYMKRPLAELNLITIHLGNGASMAAIKEGKCVDTTMGMTPLAGLVMGTRSGDIDPALPFFMAERFRLSLKDIDTLLNKDSGLKGLCGSNDMREVIEQKDAGDENSRVALEVYAYRIKKYIGSYFASLGTLDAIIFTAGIGENVPYIRELCCSDLDGLGIEIDPERNNGKGNGIREINSAGSKSKILVIPTDEELKIARETKKLIENSICRPAKRLEEHDQVHGLPERGTLSHYRR